MVKQQLNEKTKIKKDLYKWIWKEFKRSKNDKELYLKYLKLKIEESDDSILVNWLNEQIELIESENWEQLDINIGEREKQLLIHLLMKKGYTSKQAFKIIEGIRFVEKKEEFVE